MDETSFLPTMCKMSKIDIQADDAPWSIERISQTASLSQHLRPLRCDHGSPSGTATPSNIMSIRPNSSQETSRPSITSIGMRSCFDSSHSMRLVRSGWVAITVRLALR